MLSNSQNIYVYQISNGQLLMGYTDMLIPGFDSNANFINTFIWFI